MVSRIARYFGAFLQLRKALGGLDLLRVGFFRLGFVALGLFREKIVSVRVKGMASKLAVRTGHSDFAVFRQIFITEEYAPVADFAGVKTVIDCGANVGYASAYFHWKLRPARILAVEPDPANLAVCRANLGPLGAGAEAIEAGVWPESTGLVVERGTFRDGADWSITVRPARAGEKPDVNALGMPDLIRLTGADAIDLLKIDIEGSERELFSGDCDWLRQVRNLVVELHDDQCERAFRRATADYEFDETRTVDSVVCKNVRHRDSAPAATNPHQSTLGDAAAKVTPH